MADTPSIQQAALTNIRVQKWVVYTSITLFLLKVAAYFLTNSVAILTDALESTVNVVTGFTGLYSLRLAAKPRDENHPYGHGKIELISASFEGVLILVAGMIILYESLSNLIHAHPVKQLDAGILIIASTAVVNYILGWWCVNTGKKHHSQALQASGKHLQSDTWTTLGIIVGLILLRFTGISWIDSAVAMIFAGFIMIEGGKIIRSTIAGLTDEADEALLRQLISVLNVQKRQNWIDIHNLRIIKYGSVIHLDCHLTVPWYLNVNEAHAELETLGETISKAFDQDIESFVHTDGCVPPKSCEICPLIDCSVRKAAFTSRLEWTLENITSNQKHGIS
ncbi:MAG TPA: cation diffusion facilitator family transporter [Saprospirales bacterium]|nr:cation diffusion facilitator family transporter [Saprospirales bacterium]